MLREVGGGRKLLRADVARVHLLDGVLQHVALHLVGAAECLVADLAGERRREVDRRVLPQPAALEELLPADPARERALVRVQPGVRAQLREAVEPRAAAAARVVRLGVMAHHVRPQASRQRELAAADLARERTVARVTVTVQMTDQRERLLADLTHVTLQVITLDTVTTLTVHSYDLNIIFSVSINFSHFKKCFAVPLRAEM